jgi:hypothetical protein
MKIIVDTNADPFAAAATGIEIGTDLYLNDITNLRISYVEPTEPITWLGTGVVKARLCTEANEELTNTQAMQWVGNESQVLLDLTDPRLDAFLGDANQVQVILELQVEYDGHRRTLVRQGISFFKTFMASFTVELTLPAEPDQVEVGHTPEEPSNLSVIKFPEQVLEIQAIIIDGNEQYTPYEPSNVTAINLFTVRPPEDVQAFATPAAPSNLIAGKFPSQPDQLTTGIIPEQIDLLVVEVTPAAPSNLTSNYLPEEPDQVAALAKPLAPDLVSTEQLTPATPSMLNVGIDDFQAARFTPVLHVDMSTETDTLVFDEYDAANDPDPATTDYDFKIDNLVGICDGLDLDEHHLNLYRLRGYYRKTSGHTHRDFANNLLGDAYFMIYPIKTDFSTWTETTTLTGHTEIDKDWTQIIPFHEVPGFCYADGEWRLCRYNVVSNQFKNFQYDVTEENCSANLAHWTPTTDTKYPSEIPYADFTHGVVTEDLRPAALTNHGNPNYQLVQTDWYKRGVAGLYRINGLNTLSVGNENIEETPGLPATRMKLSYETNNPFETGAGSNEYSTFGEVEMVFAMKLRRNAGSISDHMFIGNGNGDLNTSARFTAHIPWGRTADPSGDGDLVGSYYFDAGNGNANRVSGLGDDQYNDTVIVSLTSSVANDLIQLRVNGRLLQEKTGAIPINIGDTLKIPAAFDPQNVHIGEILFFRNILGVSRIEKVEGYLGHKWDVARLYPESHPWRYIKPFNADDHVPDPFVSYFPNEMTVGGLWYDKNYDSTVGEDPERFSTWEITNDFETITKAEMDSWPFREPIKFPSNYPNYAEVDGVIPSSLRVGDILYFPENKTALFPCDQYYCTTPGQTGILGQGTCDSQFTEAVIPGGTYMRIKALANASTNNGTPYLALEMEYGDGARTRVDDTTEYTGAYPQIPNTDNFICGVAPTGAVLRSYPSSGVTPDPDLAGVLVVSPDARYITNTPTGINANIATRQVWRIGQNGGAPTAPSELNAT